MLEIGGRALADAEWKEHSESMLDSEDSYGFSNIKLEAEAWYTNHPNFTVDNVAEILHNAASTNCPKLKDDAMEFKMKNGEEVIASDSLLRLHESVRITREILSAAFSNMKKRKHSG